MTGTATATAKEARPRGVNVARWAEQAALPVTWLVLIIVYSIAAPEVFPSWANASNVLGAQAVAAGVEDAEGVVAQADGLGEGQGDVTGGGLEDGAVLGVGGPEGRVGRRRSRTAEEEQDQHGAQQHQPLKSPPSPACAAACTLTPHVTTPYLGSRSSR